MLKQVWPGKLDSSLLGACHGVRANVIDCGGKSSCRPAVRKYLGRTDIGDDAAGPKTGSNLRKDLLESEYRGGDDDKLSGTDALAQVIGDFVRDAQTPGLAAG